MNKCITCSTSTQQECSHIHLGEFVKLDATGQASSVVCAERRESKLKLAAGLLPFNSARSKLIANRMLPRPANNYNTNNYWMRNMEQTTETSDN